LIIVVAVVVVVVAAAVVVVVDVACSGDSVVLPQLPHSFLWRGSEGGRREGRREHVYDTRHQKPTTKLDGLSKPLYE